MLLQQSNQEVTVVGADEEASSFSIAMNGKAFRVLSSTLYQDKIGSIVREISTNALDAHVMAGNADEPFLVHLPDEYEPWFSVKDYGVGLSDAQIKDTYTKYFQSTKDQSNQTTGAFGLGSKTPFSYTDQFTVTSVYGGVRSIYSAYLTPAGVPSIQKMHSEETDERNGVEIKLSVKSGDYYTFRNKVIEQLRFFPVYPTLENAPYNFKFDEKVEPTIEQNGFRIYKGAGKNFVVQGPVGYEFNLNLYTSRTLNETAKVFACVFLNRSHLEMVFNIGEIGVTASRESVEYTDETIVAIDKKFLEIKSAMENRIQTTFSGLSNWEIACEANVFGSKQQYEKFLNSVSTKPTIRYGSFSYDTPSSIAITQRSRFNKKGTALRMIQAEAEIEFVIVDDCKYKKQRISEMIASSAKPILFVEFFNGTSEATFRLAMGGYSKPFKKLSDVPYMPAKRASVGSLKSNCWKYNGDTTIREWEKLSELPEDEEVCYVLVNNLQATDSNYFTDISVYKNAGLLSYDRPNLYAIREKDEKKFIEANPDAKKLGEWVTEFKNDKREQAIETLRAKKIVETFGDIFVNPKIVKAIAFSEDSRLIKLYGIYSKAKNKYNSATARIVCQVWSFDFDKDYVINTLNKIVNKEKSRRPILIALDHYNASKLSDEHLAKYLSVIV